MNRSSNGGMPWMHCWANMSDKQHLSWELTQMHISMKLQKVVLDLQVWKHDKTLRLCTWYNAFRVGVCGYHLPGPRGNQKFLVDQKFLVFPEKPKKKSRNQKIFGTFLMLPFCNDFLAFYENRCFFRFPVLNFMKFDFFFGFPYFSLGMFFCFNIVFGFTLFLVSFFFWLCVFFGSGDLLVPMFFGSDAFDGFR